MLASGGRFHQGSTIVEMIAQLAIAGASTMKDSSELASRLGTSSAHELLFIKAYVANISVHTTIAMKKMTTRRYHVYDSLPG